MSNHETPHLGIACQCRGANENCSRCGGFGYIGGIAAPPPLVAITMQPSQRRSKQRLTAWRQPKDEVITKQPRPQFKCEDCGVIYSKPKHKGKCTAKRTKTPLTPISNTSFTEARLVSDHQAPKLRASITNKNKPRSQAAAPYNGSHSPKTKRTLPAYMEIVSPPRKSHKRQVIKNKSVDGGKRENTKNLGARIKYVALDGAPTRGTSVPDHRGRRDSNGAHEFYRENGRFGSHPLFDDYSEEGDV